MCLCNKSIDFSGCEFSLGFERLAMRQAGRHFYVAGVRVGDGFVEAGPGQYQYPTMLICGPKKSFHAITQIDIRQYGRQLCGTCCN